MDARFRHPGRLLRPRRAGANAVEFGVGLVVLVLLVGGILDWGWFLHNEQHAIEAARAGARAGASIPLDDDPAGMAIYRVNEVLAERGLDGAEVQAWQLDLADDSVIAVSVKVPFDPLVHLVPVPGELRGAMTMRMEEQP